MLPKCLKDVEDWSEHLFTGGAKKILKYNIFAVSIFVESEEEDEDEGYKELSII